MTPRAAFAATVALVFLPACGRETAAEKKPAPEHAAAPANTVRLTVARQRQAGIAVEPAAVRSIPQTLRSPARLSNNENQTWRVGAVTEGRVVKVLANPGDAVAYSQVLARLHSHEIHESRAAYTRALAELGRVRSSLAYAGRLRDRARRLLELKAASVEQLEHAEAEVRNAETAVRNAEVDVDRTRRHLSEFLGIPAETTPEKHGHEDDDADLIPVRAPASGVVLSRAVTPGTVVNAASELFVLTDLSLLWALADVNEEHLPRLRTGMRVRLYVQAYGERAFTGRIGKLGEALDPDTRTVKVRVDVPNQRRLLKPEMYATAEIELGGSESGIFIHTDAVQEMRGATAVFVRKGSEEFEVRPVELAGAPAGFARVVRGLEAGDAVVTAGSFILKSEFLKASMAEEE
jgi:cobalt-zinc-cadmium efflux system membrane fusion protein